jgi:hypothetical protein
MRSAWPDGVPPEEDAILVTLDPARREKAAVRLRALLRYEMSAKRGEARSLPSEMGRATFFELLRAWRKRRSLTSIVPRARPHGSSDRQTDDVLKAVKTVASSNPKASRRIVAELAAARLESPPALTTLEGVVDRVRVEAERASLGGPRGFGRRVVTDTCPVSMRVHGRENPTSPRE